MSHPLSGARSLPVHVKRATCQPPPAGAVPPYLRRRPGAKPEEVAEIFVDRFVYWETVWVQNRRKDAWPIFRFIAVEAAKKV